MNDWSLVYEGFDPEQEGLREALCTLGNGYFATRGAAPECDAAESHYPGTYLSGGYNRLKTVIAGRIVENEDLVNFPNWLVVKLRLDDEDWCHLRDLEILSYRQELDLRRGILHRSVRFRDRRQRETTLTMRRIVHMSRRHLAAQEITIRAENWSGIVTVHSALDGRVINSGVARYRDLNSHHLEPIETSALGDTGIYLKVRTSQSRLEMAQASVMRLAQNGERIMRPSCIEREEDYIAREHHVRLGRGDELTVEKIVAIHTSRDTAISECGLEAREAALQAPGFDELLEEHTLAWEHLWRRFGIDLREAPNSHPNSTAMVLRLHIFHLLQSTSMHTTDLDVGVPARGWHGEAYRGHIFWDELFIFPLLNLRVPEITRTLLKYRFRRIGRARAAARDEGYRGAMYPWQSGSNGREESQLLHLNPKSGRWIPDETHLQRHVNAAIAYNVWGYFEATQDTEFLSFCGAEMFLEIARFWASASTWNQGQGRYEILGVVGPDEYHTRYPGADKPGLDNNAYTNVMAAWVLGRVPALLEHLSEDRRRELLETLRISPEELNHWDQVSRRMKIAWHDDGIISQFEGYERLREFDWDGYRRKHGDIHRLDRILEADGDSPNNYKASKQADVLMLLYLFNFRELKALFERLGYGFDADIIHRNIDYYLQRTSHGSTLSSIVHAWVLARSDRSASWDLFRQALRSDIADVQGGTTPEGIHLGAMAGTVDLVQRCYLGIETFGDVLWINPCPPDQIESLALEIRYRGHTLDLRLERPVVHIKCLRSAERPIRIGYEHEEFTLREGETREFPAGRARRA